MFELFKRVWPALCVSIFANTASAAIPDASGVIHGCYNLLTGSARIIDGTSCNLLERHVAWQQTGPQGPQGTQGPAGPAGASSVSIGRTGIQLQLDPAGAPKFTFAPGARHAPTKEGTCVVTLSAFMSSSEEPPQVSIVPALSFADGVGANVGQVPALLHTVPSFDDLRPWVNFYSQGATTYGFRVFPGQVYLFGAQLSSEAPLPPDTLAQVEVTWVCQDDDSNPDM